MIFQLYKLILICRFEIWLIPFNMLALSTYFLVVDHPDRICQLADLRVTLKLKVYI